MWSDRKRSEIGLRTLKCERQSEQERKKKKKKGFTV